MYKIPLKQCEEVFIGETDRQFGVRLAEHRKEAEKTSNMNFTRSISRYSANKYHKSAITGHVCQTIMLWIGKQVKYSS